VDGLLYCVLRTGCCTASTALLICPSALTERNGALRGGRMRAESQTRVASDGRRGQ